MKKVISGILCAMVLMFGMVSAYAETPTITNPIQQTTSPPLLYMVNTTLKIVNGQAICDGTIIVNDSSALSVSITLTLERMSISGNIWLINISSSMVFNSGGGTFQMVLPVIMGYMYRVKAVYHVNLVGGGTISIVDYSKIVIY
jgi:hypothetical protein